jgi:hypothetical protein
VENKKEKKGNWTYQRAQLKKKFPQLNDTDLLYEQGQKDVMLEKVQLKIGKNRQELEKIISEL